MMGGGFGMGLWWIIGIIVLIAAIWPVSRGFNRNNNGDQTPEKSPVDILKGRYARGEIDKREFDERKQDLI
jgi:putative membrane protein